MAGPVSTDRMPSTICTPASGAGCRLPSLAALGGRKNSGAPSATLPEVPPRVEYELTGLGKSLLAPTQALLDWVGNNWPDIKNARGKFDERGPKLK
jgi:hypothetical protein